MNDTTKAWGLYRKGLDYNRRISLNPTVDKCERFYASDQWNGVKANGLPTPVLNLMKRVIDYKVSQVLSNTLKIQYTLKPKQHTQQMLMYALQSQEMGVPFVEVPEDPTYEILSTMFSEYGATTWERLKMDDLLERTVLKAAITGDGFLYFPWDKSVEIGDGISGDIGVEELDSVNVFFGNPNDYRINAAGKPVQPYIILAFRDLVQNLRDEAEADGQSQDMIDRIVPDNDYSDQAGDLGKIELDDASKCIALLVLRYNKDTGTIWAEKSTKAATIKKAYDTGKRLYPIAGMQWQLRSNCYHGESEAKAIIPNQLAINKLLAQLILTVTLTAFPKMIYDKTAIPNKPSNTVGEIIGVEGLGVRSVKDLVTYLDTGNTSPEAYKLLDNLISLTKEMLGANEVALGEVKPENTSAFIAVNQASTVPLAVVQHRLYQMVEDIGHIWLDYWLSEYVTPRALTLTKNDSKSTVIANLSKYKDDMFSVKVDVGPSSQYSELTSIQMLDNLLNTGQINIVEYLERIPKGLMPKQKELIDKKQAEIEQQQQIQAMLQQLQAMLQQRQGVQQQMQQPAP